MRTDFLLLDQSNFVGRSSVTINYELIICEYILLQVSVDRVEEVCVMIWANHGFRVFVKRFNNKSSQQEDRLLHLFSVDKSKPQEEIYEIIVALRVFRRTSFDGYSESVDIFIHKPF